MRAFFKTDSSMFRVNEAHKGTGVLTKKNGAMTIHVSLSGKKIVNLYLGTAENAPNDKAHWLFPTEDTVEYADGMKEKVFGFDIPVEKLGEEFSLALLGTKGIWYDHKVKVELVQ